MNRRITEDDLARVMMLDARADQLEIMALRLGSKPYVTQDDIAEIITITFDLRNAGHIMRRFLNGHADVQVAIESGKGFTEAKEQTNGN